MLHIHWDSDSIRLHLTLDWETRVAVIAEKLGFLQLVHSTVYGCFNLNKTNHSESRYFRSDHNTPDIRNCNREVKYLIKSILSGTLIIIVSLRSLVVSSDVQGKQRSQSEHLFQQLVFMIWDITCHMILYCFSLL